MIKYWIAIHSSKKTVMMKTNGLQFWINEQGKDINPFFTSDEDIRKACAELLLDSDSELLNTPKKHMSFRNGDIEVIMLD